MSIGASQVGVLGIEETLQGSVVRFNFFFFFFNEAVGEFNGGLWTGSRGRGGGGGGEGRGAGGGHAVKKNDQKNSTGTESWNSRGI